MEDFFAAIYEGFHPLDLFYIKDFSQDMYTSGIYISIGIVMIISSFLLMTFYYYSLSNFKNFYKNIYWILWIVIIAVINFFVAYYNSLITIENLYDAQGNPYGFTQFFTFSMVNVFWTIIFCFLFSMVLKIKSITASKTPF